MHCIALHFKFEGALEAATYVPRSFADITRPVQVCAEF